MYHEGEILVGLEAYQKDQAIERIVGYFNCTISEISKKALFEMVSEEVAKIGLDTKSKINSNMKVFSLYQAAIIFIYQELSDISEEPFFDATLHTIKHKESISELIMTACEFADAYISLNNSEQISQVNDALIKEYRRLQEDIKDDSEIKNLKMVLFDKSGYSHIKTQVAKVLHVQEAYQEKQDYTTKLFRKSDIYTLMLLFKLHEDRELTQAYVKLKEQCNITKPMLKNIEKEMKYIANDYMYSQDKQFLQLCNQFFIDISNKVHNQAFMRINHAFIDESFQVIDEDIKTVKWHHKLWMKKDRWLLVKNTIQIQKELYAIQQQYTSDEMQTHKFLGNHKVFSLVAVILQEYDRYFHTIGQLSDLLEHDFTGYAEVAAMNIKNFYEDSTDVIEIEAINRLLFFWMQISRKSLLKQLNKSENELFV